MANFKFIFAVEVKEDMIIIHRIRGGETMRGLTKPSHCIIFATLAEAKSWCSVKYPKVRVLVD